MARRASRLLALAALMVMAGVAMAADRDDAFIGYSERTIARGGCERVDTNEECARWANIGECERNPAYMSGACAKSCDSPCPPALGRRGGAPSNLGVAHRRGRRAHHPPRGPLPRRFRVLPRLCASSTTVPRLRVPSRRGGARARRHRQLRRPRPALRPRSGPLRRRRALGPARGGRPARRARDSACVVGGGPDFFVATRPHHEGEADTPSSARYPRRTCGSSTL